MFISFISFIFLEKRGGDMAWYLLLSWISLIFAVVFIGLKRLAKDSKSKTILDSFTGFFIVFMVFLFMVAIAMKDPITDLISEPYQLLLSALAGSFAVWKYYLNPLKSRVTDVEKNVVSLSSKVDEGFSGIKSDLTLIKNKLMSNEPERKR